VIYFFKIGVFNYSPSPGADFSKWVKAEEIAEVIHFYASEEGAVLREGVIKVYGSG
jgi:hypothetical protein